MFKSLAILSTLVASAAATGIHPGDSATGSATLSASGTISAAATGNATLSASASDSAATTGIAMDLNATAATTTGMVMDPSATGMAMGTGEVQHARMCDENLCIVGMRMNGTDSFTLSPKIPIPEADFGWIAMGFGKSMLNSPMVVMWPNDDCSFTLSQRQATDYAPPNVTEPARVATINEEWTYANETATSFTFSLATEANATASLEIIYAYSRTNPGSADPAAPLKGHAWAAPAVLEFKGGAGGKKKCASKRKRSRRA